MLDIISITVTSGSGGDWCVAARREAGVPFGGPAGWDGGQGGDVIFKATVNEQTLTRFRHHNHIEAKSGQDGMIKDRYGANAPDMIVHVPVGTVVRDKKSGHIIFQLTTDREEKIIARGWKWWAGNIHFKNSVNQYPNFALLWEPGQSYELQIELQMLGDIWLIGMPSVGKSSLINTCCDTKAKTADYHFTTLEPNIGICGRVDPSFSMVDIPGLVAGASDGKGLWNQFLRHILKARIFALVVDMDSYEAGFSKLTTVFDEIIAYIQQRFVGSKDFGPEITQTKLDLTAVDGHIILTCSVTMDDQEEILFQKAIHIVANKYDMVNDLEIAQEFMQTITTYLSSHFQEKYWRSVSQKDLLDNSFVVSAATHHGIEHWISELAQVIKSQSIKNIHLFDTVQIQEIKHQRVTDITDSDFQYLMDEWYIDGSSSRSKVWQIRDPEICRLVNILPRSNEQAEHRFRNVMMKKKYLNEFAKHGVMHGDIMKIMSYYAGVEDRYIMYV